MRFVRIEQDLFEELKQLHRAYKTAIREEPPTEKEEEALIAAIKKGLIQFFGCVRDETLIGCCSISCTFSTFNYQKAGVFEDFYILPEYRHQGIARKLVEYAITESGVKSLTVGCADCDEEMYKALGFSIPLGNLLANDIDFRPPD